MVYVYVYTYLLLTYTVAHGRIDDDEFFLPRSEYARFASVVNGNIFFRINRPVKKKNKKFVHDRTTWREAPARDEEDRSSRRIIIVRV